LLILKLKFTNYLKIINILRFIMTKNNSNSTNVTISFNKESLELLNKLCELEHRKRCNQIIHMMQYYIKKNNIKIK